MSIHHFISNATLNYNFLIFLRLHVEACTKTLFFNATKHFGYHFKHNNTFTSFPRYVRAIATETSLWRTWWPPCWVRRGNLAIRPRRNLEPRPAKVTAVTDPSVHFTFCACQQLEMINGSFPNIIGLNGIISDMWIVLAKGQWKWETTKAEMDSESAIWLFIHIISLNEWFVCYVVGNTFPITPVSCLSAVFFNKNN